MKKSISLVIVLALVFSLLAPIGVYADEESNLDKLYNRLYNSRYGKAFRETNLITVDELFDIRDELKGQGYVSDFINDIYDEISKNTKLAQFLNSKYYVSRENVNDLKDIVFDWEDANNDELKDIADSFKDGTGKPDEWNSTMIALKDAILVRFSAEIDDLKDQLNEDYKSYYGIFELSLDLSKAVLENLIVKETNKTPDLKFSIDKNGLYNAIEEIENKYVAEDGYKLTESFTLSQLSATIDGIADVVEEYYGDIKPVVKEIAGISDKQIAGIIKKIVTEENYIPYKESTTPPGSGGSGGGAPAPTEPELPDVTVPEDENLPATITIGEDQISVKIKEGTAYVSVNSKEAVKAVEKLRDEAGKDREAVLNIDLSSVERDNVSVEFPYDLIKAAIDNKVSLNMVFDDVEVLVPFDVLGAADIEKGDKVVFRFEDVTQLVNGAAGEDQDVKMGIDLFLEVVRKDNVIRIDEFKVPVVVKIEVKGSWNSDKLAVYHLNEDDNTLEFVTGKIVDNHIMVILNHFSKYLVVESNKTFSDITNHWAKLYIESMAAKNVVDGYNDGTFRPSNNVTRAEFSKMILKGLEVELVKYNGEFKDVEAHDWYADYLATMKKLGLAEGYGDGTFRPDQYITRAEIAVILSNVLDVEVDEDEIDSLLANYTDKDQIPDWAKEAIAKVVKSKVMVGDNNRFKPSDNTTRAESATTIYRIYNR